MEEVFDKRGNKTGEKEVQSKLYPGYVFVKMVMNDNTWYIVRNTRGCTCLLYTSAQWTTTAAPC